MADMEMDEPSAASQHFELVLKELVRILVEGHMFLSLRVKGLRCDVYHVLPNI